LRINKSRGVRTNYKQESVYNQAVANFTKLLKMGMIAHVEEALVAVGGLLEDQDVATFTSTTHVSCEFQALTFNKACVLELACPFRRPDLPRAPPAVYQIKEREREIHSQRRPHATHTASSAARYIRDSSHVGFLVFIKTLITTLITTTRA